MAEEKILYEIKENIAEIKSTLKSNAENTDLKFQLQEEKIKVANNRISDLENSNIINTQYKVALDTIVNGILYGILCWGVAVGVNQTYKQLNKSE